jgi:hypothetical protein
MDLADTKTQKRQRKADTVTTGNELLGEQDHADRAEQIQRPRDRPCDEQGGERALR